MNWQDKTLLERIQDRWTELDTKYGKVNRNRETIIQYFRCDELVDINEEGEFVGEEIYNASGMWYSQMMARGFQGTFVPKNIPWLAYILDMYELQGVDPLDEWIQEVTKYMTDDYRRSNFYDVQPQFILDSITTGSPVMFGEEDIPNRRLMWLPIHYKNVRVYYDKYNEDEGCIIKDPQWTAKQLYDTFIQRDDESGTRRKALLPTFVNQALEQGLLNQEFTVYRATFKANDPIWYGWNKPRGDWKWLSVYFCDGAEKKQQDKPLNQNMGYFTKPYVVNNYDKKPWECSSRTPAWYAFWDNQGLQEKGRAFMENMQLKNRPPRYALSGMEGRIDFSSEGVTYLDREEYDRPPKALDLIGDVNLNEKIVELDEGKMRRWFMGDLWARFSDLVRTNKQPVSAAQIWQMVAEKSTQLSPAIESYSKYLTSSDARHIDVAGRRGEYPFDPWTLRDVYMLILQHSRRPVQSIKITPIFVNALIQAQKRSQELEPILSGIRLIVDSGAAQLFPEAKYIMRGYETLDDMLQAGGFPQADVRPKLEVNKMVQAENEARAKQLQFENAVELAKASKPASDAAANLMQEGT